MEEEVVVIIVSKKRVKTELLWRVDDDIKVNDDDKSVYDDDICEGDDKSLSNVSLSYKEPRLERDHPLG